MTRSRLQLAKPKVLQALAARSNKVLRHTDLVRLLAAHRSAWKLPAAMSLSKFLAFAISEGALTRVQLALAHRKETMYAAGNVPLLVLALAAKPKSYLTHFSAMALHHLTDQVSKTVYVNVEQRPQPSNPGSLTQESIDRAFRNQQRRTTNVAEYEGYRLMYLNGKHTGQLGVMDHRLGTGETVRVTDLERTLIDIAVRPAYSGGVAEVLGAYRAAKDRVSVGRLLSMLDEMRYVYPYGQAVGFYLQRAGVDGALLRPLRERPMRFDFYLAHGMREREHVAEWRLFIPKGL